MTREEANKELERAFDVLDHSCHMDYRRKEAFNMARLALFAQQIGQWIEERDDYGEITCWHCSNCYDHTGFITTCAWNYCPTCGAKMVEPQESEG